MQSEPVDHSSSPTPWVQRWEKYKPKVILGAKILGGLVALGILSVLILFLSVKWGAFGNIPTENALKQIQNHQASEIYASDGELLGKYFRENRTEVAYKDISPQLIEALIATEDARFYDHAGVDTRSLFRVFFKSVLMGNKSSGGGSTLSQQLAKNLYPRERHGMLTMPVNKFKEMITAKRLERVYSKEEILALYLNTVAFGEDLFGIGTATQRFFSTTPKQIKLEDAAVLVGMLKANTAYNPRLNPERSLTRRNVVLQQMVQNGYLAQAQADSLRSLPLELSYRNVTQSVGIAPYFRQEIADEIQDWLNAHPSPSGKVYDLLTDGLKIYTTLDAGLQRSAESVVRTHLGNLQQQFDKHWKGRKLWNKADPQIQKAVKESHRYQSMKAGGASEEDIWAAFDQDRKMEVWSWQGWVEKEMSPLDSVMYYQSFLQAGFLAVDPRNGYVKAWVGGGKYERFQYDHVTSKRQVGSTFKPIVYAAALEKGVDPCEYIPNEKVVYTDYENWAPGNADGKYEGYYSMKGGLTHSVNTISAAVMMKVGVAGAHRIARDFGIESELPDGPSLVLGTADISLKEMVGAYTTFANRGKRSRLIYLTRIENAAGEVLVEFPTAPKSQRVLDPKTADMMADMMQSVVNQGTGSRLRRVYGLNQAIAGKTGTTQDQTDGWFIGVTPHLVAGAWVGGETRKVRFRSLSLGQGSNTALPIYGKFMQQYFKKNPKSSRARFQAPDEASREKLDCELFSETPQNGGIDELLLILKQQRMERQIRRAEQAEERRKRRKKKIENFFKRKN